MSEKRNAEHRTLNAERPIEGIKEIGVDMGSGQSGTKYVIFCGGIIRNIRNIYARPRKHVDSTVVETKQIAAVSGETNILTFGHDTTLDIGGERI